MTAADDFLRAIIADPSDTLSRLAYADWLDESGDEERAAFIRSDPALFPFSYRHYRDWFHPGPIGRMIPTNPIPLLARDPASGLWDAYMVGRGITFRFRKGFLEEVSLTSADWREHGPSLVRSHPLTRVRLTDIQAIRWREDPLGWRLWSRPLYPSDPIEAVPLHPFIPRGYFPCPESAHEGLSAACLLWAHTGRPVHPPVRAGESPARDSRRARKTPTPCVGKGWG